MKTLTVASVALFFLLAEGLHYQSGANNGPVKRDISVSAGPHYFQITSVKADNATGRPMPNASADAIQFLFDTSGLPRFALRFFHRNGDNADALAVRWNLWKIIEYVESGANEGFEPDQDTVASEFKFFNSVWSQLQDTKFNSSDGTEVHQICTSLTGAQPRPDVTICLFIAAAPTEFGGFHHDPNAIKWSLNISNYPYKVNDSRLALKFSFGSRARIADFGASEEREFAPSHNESALVCGNDGNGNKGIAGYTTSIGVSGSGCSANGTVVRTVIREGDWANDTDADLPPPSNQDPDYNVQFDGVKRVGYFSFITDCQPSSIFWDPELGVGQTTSSSPDSVVNSAVSVLPSVVFAFATIATLLL